MMTLIRLFGSLAGILLIAYIATHPSESENN